MNRLHRGRRLVGLHTALGIGRMAGLTPRVSRRQQAASAIRGLERGTQRNIVRFALLAMATLLGFWGFQSTVPPVQNPWAASVVWNNLFKTLQLLTTQFPNDLSTTTTLPLQLQIARFAMPVFAVWFTATALLRRFNRPLLAWRAGLARNHVVLIGASDVSVALAHAYRTLGRSVVAVVPPVAADVASPVEVAGAAVVFGDADEELVLRRAAIHRAAAVIAADDVGTGAVGLAGAVAAANGRRGRGDPPLIFLIRLAHRELRALVATQIASAMQQNRVDLRLYVRERSLARSLLARYPSDWGLAPGPHDIHAAIVGLGDMGIELLLQLARVAVPEPGRRTILTLIDRNANGLKEQLLGEHPGLAHCAELRFIEADVHASAIKAAEIEAWLIAPLPATAIYVSCGDDHANLAMAMGLRRAYAHAHAQSPPVFVYQRAGSELVEALPHMHATVFDTRRIVAFGRIEDEADPFYLVDEEIDDLARLMHEDYLESRRRMAESSGTPLDATGAAVPWPELADIYRAANRSQADHLQMKLRSLGWHATERGGGSPEIDPERLEVLAAQEHERWSRDRWMAGWTYAATRDDALLHHPDLRPYAELSEPVRDFDRQTLRRLPSLLKQAGMGLSRDRRVGVWFAHTAAPPSGRLVNELAGKLAALASLATDLHLQLVLPLRSAAEIVVATALARNASVGVDSALLGTTADRTGLLDRKQARDLIDASDRAFVLAQAPSSPEGDSAVTREAAALSAVCRVCDEVMLAAESATASEALLGRLDAAGRAKIMPVVHA